MMNEGLICLTTNLETNSNFTRSNSGVERRDGIWVNSATGLGLEGAGGGSHPGWMLLKSAAQAKHCLASSRQSELQHQHRSHHCLQCFCWLAWCGAGGVSIKQSAPHPSSQHCPVEYCTTQTNMPLEVEGNPAWPPPASTVSVALLGRHRQSHGRGIICTITLQHQIRSSVSGPTLPIGTTQSGQDTHIP